MAGAAAGEVVVCVYVGVGAGGWVGGGSRSVSGGHSPVSSRRETRRDSHHTCIHPRTCVLRCTDGPHFTPPHERCKPHPQPRLLQLRRRRRSVAVGHAV